MFTSNTAVLTVHFANILLNAGSPFGQHRQLFSGDTRTLEYVLPVAIAVDNYVSIDYDSRLIQPLLSCDLSTAMTLL
jgi:hypothetical protein